MDAAWRVMRVVMAGGFLKSYVEGLLAAVTCFLLLATGVGDVGVSVFLGTGIGSHILFTLLSGFLVRSMGVRRLLLVSAVFPLVGVALMVLPTGSLWSLVTGNVFKGVSFGIMAMMCPLLIGAEAPSARKGASAMYQLSMQLGSVFGALAGGGVAFVFGSKPALAVNLDFLLMLLPVACYLPLVLGCTPPSAVSIGSGASFSGCVRHLRSSWPAVVFMMLMSATGVGVVMNYSVVMFSDAGFSGSSANFVDALTRGLPILSVAAVAWLGGNCGRFRLLCIGGLLMAVGSAGAAFTTGWLFAACIIVQTNAFYVSFGTCAWALVPELVPIGIRAQGVAVTMLAGQLLSMLMISVYPQLRTAFGGPAVMLAFAAAAFVSVMFFKLIRHRI